MRICSKILVNTKPDLINTHHALFHAECIPSDWTPMDLLPYFLGYKGNILCIIYNITYIYIHIIYNILHIKVIYYISLWWISRIAYLQILARVEIAVMQIKFKSYSENTLLPTHAIVATGIQFPLLENSLIKNLIKNSHWVHSIEDTLEI